MTTSEDIEVVSQGQSQVCFEEIHLIDQEYTRISFKKSMMFKQTISMLMLKKLSPSRTSIKAKDSTGLPSGLGSRQKSITSSSSPSKDLHHTGTLLRLLFYFSL